MLAHRFALALPHLALRGSQPKVNEESHSTAGSSFRTPTRLTKALRGLAAAVGNAAGAHSRRPARRYD